MAHLSSPEMPWGKPFTNKRYVHPPFAENIVTAWPNTMVMIGEITAENPQEMRKGVGPYECGFVGALPSAAVLFTLKRESDLLFRQRKREQYKNYIWEHELLPIRGTRYRTRADGIPIHALTKDMDVLKLSEEVFCDGKRVSTAYIKLTVENTLGVPQKIELGVLARSGPECLFTGCPEPDGYDGYHPRREYLEDAEMIRYERYSDRLTDGTYTLWFDPSIGFCKGETTDLLLPMELAPYEKRSFTFALTRSKERPLPYAVARREAMLFWKKELGKAKYVPDKKGIEPLFYNFLAQMLQMLACPRRKEYTIIRQGATQRYHWPEAKEVIRALALIGGYEDCIDRALSHYFFDLQERDGENAGRIHYPYVPWNSRTAAGLEMFSYAVDCDVAFFEKYKENAISAFRWMERERARSKSIPGAIEGLFPPGIATDNHFSGAQQWTFSDTAMLRGYKALLTALADRDESLAREVKAAYDDYFGVMRRILDTLASEQEKSEFLYLPRDPKNDPATEEALNKDPFYYMFPNEALAAGLAGYGTEVAEKILYTYSHSGQEKNGLIYPVYRSVGGTGRTWYTTWAEHSRYIYYKRAGDREGCRRLLDALLKYNVTTEYYQCERYDDHDAYTAPWMPNASANGRLLHMLFDYYGKRKNH